MFLYWLRLAFLFYIDHNRVRSGVKLTVVVGRFKRTFVIKSKNKSMAKHWSTRMITVCYCSGCWWWFNRFMTVYAFVKILPITFHHYLVRFSNIYSIFLSSNFAVRAEAAFYGSNWIGPCHTGHWLSSELFGTFFKDTNVYNARRWTIAIWLPTLFGHHCEYIMDSFVIVLNLVKHEADSMQLWIRFFFVTFVFKKGREKRKKW